MATAPSSDRPRIMVNSFFIGAPLQWPALAARRVTTRAPAVPVGVTRPSSRRPTRTPAGRESIAYPVTKGARARLPRGGHVRRIRTLDLGFAADQRHSGEHQYRQH